MKKRILAVVLAVCCILATTTFPTPANALNNLDPTEMQGVSVSAENFGEIFSGNPRARTAPAPNALSDSELTITNVNINGENISLTLQITNGSNIVTLPIVGKLASSYKTQSNINSAVIVVPEAVNGYEVLLFEIFNDTSHDTLLLNEVGVGSELSGTPHIKVYLKDTANNLYLYEETMPSYFANINASQYDRAHKSRDALWALPYVSLQSATYATPDEKIQELTPNNNARTPSVTYTWEFPNTYTTSYYVGSDFTVHRSVPYVEFRYTDVAAQDCTWYARFMVDEETTVTNPMGPSTTFHGSGMYEYHNLKIAFSCGVDTIFIDTQQEGTIYDTNAWFNALKSTGEEVAIALLSDALNALPIDATLATVMNNIRNAIYTDGTVRLGSNNGYDLIAGMKTVVGEYLEGYSLYECTKQGANDEAGHYYDFRCTATYENVLGGGSLTRGALVVEFDVYDSSDSSYIHEYKDFRLAYTPSP